MRFGLIFGVYYLNADQDLHQRTVRGPFLLGSALPGSQNRQTDLAVVVKVRIKADIPSTGRQEGTFRRSVGVALGEEDVELEKPIGVGSVIGSGDQNLHHVTATLVHTDENTVAGIEGESIGHGSQFLKEENGLRN